MSPADDQDIAPTAAFATGDLDALTPEQVARLARHLDASPAAAAVLANARPPVEPALQGGVPTPSAAAWERVLDAVSARTDVAVRRPRLWRLWAPLVAAAASLAAAAVWNVARTPAVEPWPVAWARHVEIDNLEVAGDATPMVFTAGTDDPIPVIWVLDDRG